MNKKERIKRIESLDDLKRIRFNTGTSILDITIGVCFITTLMLCGFGYVFLFSHFLAMACIFAIFAIIFLVLSFIVMDKQEIMEEEFLLKYGKNK